MGQAAISPANRRHFDRFTALKTAELEISWPGRKIFRRRSNLYPIIIRDISRTGAFFTIYNFHPSQGLLTGAPTFQIHSHAINGTPLGIPLAVVWWKAEAGSGEIDVGALTHVEQAEYTTRNIFYHWLEEHRNSLWESDTSTPVSSIYRLESAFGV